MPGSLQSAALRNVTSFPRGHTQCSLQRRAVPRAYSTRSYNPGTTRFWLRSARSRHGRGPATSALDACVWALRGGRTRASTNVCVQVLLRPTLVLARIRAASVGDAVGLQVLFLFCSLHRCTRAPCAEFGLRGVDRYVYSCFIMSSKYPNKHLLAYILYGQRHCVVYAEYKTARDFVSGAFFFFFWSRRS